SHSEGLRRGRSAIRVQRRRPWLWRSARTRSRRSAGGFEEKNRVRLDGSKHLSHCLRSRAQQARRGKNKATTRKRAQEPACARQELRRVSEGVEQAESAAGYFAVLRALARCQITRADFQAIAIDLASVRGPNSFLALENDSSTL